MQIPNFFRRFSLAIVVVGMALAPWAKAASLYEQVQYCKDNLPVANMAPAGSCFGDNTYAFGEGLNAERVGYFRLSDKVDAVFRCDAVDEENQRLTSNSDIEMIIHHRGNGTTCFFFIDDPSPAGDFTSLSSCTGPRDCYTEIYWQAADNGSGACTTCHKNGGPYFIDSSAEVMARFGLINNGHDTKFEKYFALHVDADQERRMNEEIQEANPKFIDPSDSRPKTAGACGQSCHNFVHTQYSGGAAAGFVNTPYNSSISMVNSGVMMPLDPLSPYRWMNYDHPGASGDHEYYSRFKEKYKGSVFGGECDTPKYMEAHVVGSSHTLSSNSVYARFQAFNPADGLVCKNDDMTSGYCFDYQVRFQCGDGRWTNWQNDDSPKDGSGDHEYPPSNCTNRINIEARFYVPNPVDPTLTYTVRGFPDRLQRFDNTGLICKNADQADGQCDNYVVRFVCP